MGEIPRIAAIAGATGLVGGALVQALLRDASFDEVILFSRRRIDADDPNPRDHPKLRQIELPDFRRIGDVLAQSEVMPSHGFCALGTTLKKAGSREAFRLVDHDFITAFAAACEGQGARRFLTISSVGASAHSSNFYLRVKGETEQALIDLDFDALDIFRPGLLLGAREDTRPAERLGQVTAPVLSPFLAGPLSRYRPVAARDVAGAMAAASQTLPRAPVSLYHFHEMKALLRR